MDINYLAIFVCGILSMVVGGIWYGPIFGKKWAEIIGATSLDLEKRKAMQKAAGPFYAIQFILTLFQLGVLAFITGKTGSIGLSSALWIWGAFIVPTIAATSMWNNDSNKVKWARFSIQSGYYLVMFVIYGLILGNWK